MRDINKKTWTSPDIMSFENTEELWAHYKSKGTPEQRSRLRSLLDIASRRNAEIKLRRAG